MQELNKREIVSMVKHLFLHIFSVIVICAVFVCSLKYRSAQEKDQKQNVVHKEVCGD